MPRAIIAAMTLTLTSALALALTAGGAAAQGAVPGAADIGEYHQRYAIDANPYERAPHTGQIVEEALSGAALPRFAPDTVMLEESIVLSPVPAAMPDRPNGGPAPAAGLTPGAPLGSSDIGDGKVVAGQRR